MAKAATGTARVRSAGGIPRSEPRSARANATRARILDAARRSADEGRVVALQETPA